MPLVKEDRPYELAPQGPVNVPGAPPPVDQAAQAPGATYSGLDVLAGAAELTPYGHAESALEAFTRRPSVGRGEIPANFDREAAIPPDLLPQKDEFAGLETPLEIQGRAEELRRRNDAMRAVQSAPWGPAASWLMGFGQVATPADAAAMMIPLGGATRLIRALKFAGVGAAAAGVDELLERKPGEGWDGALGNIGTSAILSGVLGAFTRGHMSAEEFEKLASRLDEDLKRPEHGAPNLRAPFEAPGSIRGDNAANLALDIRAAVEAHRTKLQAEVESAQAGHDAAVQRAATEAVRPPEAPGQAQAAPATETRPEGGQPKPAGPGAPAGEPAPRPEPAADPVLEAQKRLEAAQAAHKAFTEPPEPSGVGERVLARLEELGRFGDADRKAYAALINQFYTTMAGRLGVSPEELFARHPLNIVSRSATGALGQGPGRPFYSAAIRAVENIRQERATGPQWLRTLENTRGVSKDELKWMGLYDYFADKDPKALYDRSELLENMRAHQVELKDVTRANLGEGPEHVAVEELERRGYQVHEDDMTGEPYLMTEDERGVATEIADGDVPDDVRELLNQLRTEGPAQYDEYSLPGGENYREHLIQWVNKPEGMEEPFRSPHFGGAQDILAHVRSNERVDAEGRRVLHIEEVQSDWHQRGRKQGYEGPETAAQREAFAAANAKARAAREALAPLLRAEDNLGFDTVSEALEAIRVHPDFQQRWDLGSAREAADAYRAAILETGEASRAIKSGIVPDAPFKKTWPELALKRMVREAVDRGLEAITWTTGRQQIERYDLGRYVDSLKAKREMDGSVVLAGRRGGTLAFQRIFAEGELDGAVGKDMADKIRGLEAGQAHEFSGLDLHVGGGGMKAFYDEQLPRLAAKLAKPFGGEVRETTVVAGDAERRGDLTPAEQMELRSLETYHEQGQIWHAPDLVRLQELQFRRDNGPLEPGKRETVHELLISPAMRDAALAGQPLFQRRAAPNMEAYGQRDLFAALPPEGGPHLEADAGRPGRTLPAEQTRRRTELVAQRTYKLAVERVESPLDAATATLHLANMADERFQGLVTDKDGKPLALIGDNKGTLDGASVHIESLLMDAFRVPGAANVWWIHNHPSGEPRLSQADERISQRLAELFRDSGIQPKGILAVAGGEAGKPREWSFQRPDGTGDFGRTRELRPDERPVEVPALHREFSQHEGGYGQLTGPRSVDTIAKANGWNDGLMLLDNRYDVIGFVPRETAFPTGYATLRTGDTQTGAAQVWRKLGETNAKAAILLDSKMIDVDALRNLSSLFAMSDLRLIDAFEHFGTPRQESLDHRLDRGGNFQQVERGAYDPSTRSIGLNENADLSTFLHEAGHHFLQMFMEVAARDDAPLNIRQDADAIIKWSGAFDDVHHWLNSDLEAQRPTHENFARTFEQYLREGTAPTPRLQSVFEKFRDWLVSIYRSSAELFGKLTPEIKGVMDRMLASADEAAQARVARVTAAPDAFLKRIAGDDVLRDGLRQMIDEAGWLEKGGRHTDDMAEGTRTEWIPRAEWFSPSSGRPGNFDEEGVRNAVEKALAGERLGPQQRRLIEYMAHVNDQVTATEPFLPHSDDLELAGLDPKSPQDTWDAALVNRLHAIDEDTVETLSRHFEDDDVGFMEAVRRQLDAYDTDAALGRGLPQEPEPRGVRDDRAAAGRPTGEAGAGDFALTSPEGARPERGKPGATQGDLFGANRTRQQLADAERARDTARNTGQSSLETGRPDDLFSESRKQVDLTDELKQGPAPYDDIAELLKQLPPEQRMAFEQRMRDLDLEQHYGGTPPVPGGIERSVPGAPGSTIADYELARGGRVLGKLLGWFHPRLRVMRSPSLMARRLVVDLMETPEMLSMNEPTPERPFGRQTPTPIELTLKHYEGMWGIAKRARDDLFNAYRKRDPAEGEPPKMDREEWNAAVSHANRTGDVHPVKEVQQAAELNRRVIFEPTKQELQKHGLLPQREDLMGGTAESYLMREYDRSKIKADRNGWNRTLVEGFLKQIRQGEMFPTKSAAEEAWDIAHRVTSNILGAERGLLDVDNVVFRDIVPQSGRLIERALKLPDVELEPYLKNDIDHLTHSYLRSIGAQLEFAKRGWDKDLSGPLGQVVDEYRVLTQRALAEGDERRTNQLTDRMRADLRDLGAMRDRLYGIFGIPSDPSGWLQRSQRVLRSVNVFRLLGTATFSHPPDAANVIMREGLVNSAVGLAKLLSSLEAIKVNSNELHRMGTALDMVTNVTAASAGEFGVDSSFKFQRLLNRGTRAFTIATLEMPWINGVKTWAGAIAQDSILEAAERIAAGKKLSRMETIRFNQQGVGQQDLERIGDQFGQFGRTVRGLRFGMTDKWTDQGARQAFEAAVVKHAEASTLTPAKGDTPLWTSSEVGKSVFQFKTFGAEAIPKVVIPLAQGLAHGDARAASGFAMLLAAGAFSYYAKQKLSGQPIDMNPGRLMLEILDKSNLLGWTGEYFYPVLWAAGMENFSRWGDRQTWETLAGPVFGTAVDAWDLRLPAKIRGAFSPYDPRAQRFTRQDLHRIRRLLPANQIWYLRRAVNNLEGWVGDRMGMPPERPRFSRSSTE